MAAQAFEQVCVQDETTSSGTRGWHTHVGPSCCKRLQGRRGNGNASSHRPRSGRRHEGRDLPALPGSPVPAWLKTEPQFWFQSPGEQKEGGGRGGGGLCDGQQPLSGNDQSMRRCRAEAASKRCCVPTWWPSAAPPADSPSEPPSGFSDRTTEYDEIPGPTPPSLHIGNPASDQLLV